MNRRDAFTRQALPPKDAARRRAAIMAAHPPPHTGHALPDAFDADGNGAVAAPAKAETAAELGSTVQILDLRTRELEEYTLVTPGNADFWLNRISTMTPLGRALYGRKVGEIVEVEAPGGAFPVRIELIENHA